MSWSASTPPCSNSDGGVCLGRLRGSLYQTVTFKPQIRYGVPSGWANYEDTPGNFLLVPPGYDLKGVNAGTSDFIGISPSHATTTGALLEHRWQERSVQIKTLSKRSMIFTVVAGIDPLGCVGAAFRCSRCDRGAGAGL
jgi:hypothetical protein